MEKGMLFEEIAKKIEQLIQDGVLKTGQKIPSIRQIKQQEGVSTSTILRAYAHLENFGLIESRPKSGFIVRAKVAATSPQQLLHVPSISEVQTGSLISDVFTAPRDPRIVNLGAASPDASIVPSKALSRHLTSSMRSAGPLVNRYEFPPGYSPLLREIARRTSMLEGKKVDPKTIIITSGAIEGINLALRAVLKPDDVLAVESPTYYGLLKAAEWLSIRTVEIPTDSKAGMDLQSLEKAIPRYKIRCVFLMPNFQNPLGSVMPDDKKKLMLSLAAKYDLTIIEDDVQGDLYFRGKRPIPLKAWDKDGRVIYISSFSKTIAPGYRLGWIRPGKFYDKILELKFTMTAGSPTLLQMTIAEYLGSGTLERYLKKLRNTFEQRIFQMSQAIQEFFPKGTKISAPNGGFLIWVELPARVDSVDLSKKSLRHGIAICPGPIFSPTGRYSNYIRLSCSLPWSKTTMEAIRSLGRMTNA